MYVCMYVLYSWAISASRDFTLELELSWFCQLIIRTRLDSVGKGAVMNEHGCAASMNKPVALNAHVRGTG